MGRGGWSEAVVVGRRGGGGKRVRGGADGDADGGGRVRRKGEGRAKGEYGGVGRGRTFRGDVPTLRKACIRD